MNIAMHAQIKCPFFMTERNNLLCCEGFVEGTCMTTKFPDVHAKTKHIRENCFLRNGGRCPMAANLFEKYKAIEEKEEAEKMKKITQRFRLTG